MSPIESQGELIFPIGANGVLDLTEALREQILLALPMQPLCRADCQGLCVQCGKNLNEGTCDCVQDTIDPRLVKLKELL